MKLEEVLPAFRKGKGIRRKFWVEYECNSTYIYITDGGLEVHCLCDDMKADDWEVEKDKKEKLKKMFLEYCKQYHYCKICSSNPEESWKFQQAIVWNFIDSLEIK